MVGPKNSSLTSCPFAAAIVILLGMLSHESGSGRFFGERLSLIHLLFPFRAVALYTLGFCCRVLKFFLYLPVPTSLLSVFHFFIFLFYQEDHLLPFPTPSFSLKQIYPLLGLMESTGTCLGPVLLKRCV
jgi:hypothetical protein